MEQTENLQTQMQQKPISPYKLVMLGDMAVGKSSIVNMFTKQKFEHQISPTLGAAYVSHDVELEDKIVRLNIWDTSGQERYASLTQSYYRNAQASIVVYDITSKDTLQRAKFWINQLRDSHGMKCIIALVGNKVDKPDQRQISTDEAMQYAKDESLLFKEISAKENIGVQQIFREIAELLHHEIKVNTDGFGIVDVNKQISKKQKCC